jgi:hypothetical protein
MQKNMINKKFIILLIIFSLISALFVFFNYEWIDASNGLLMNHSTMFRNDGECNNSSLNTEPWLSFFGMLSTLFAVFFVYSGFKIDNTKEKIENAEKRIIELERKIQEDIYEYARQLEYCMSFIVQKQFDKAIDSLTVLRSEAFVLRDGRKVNTCCFFLAHCYYEKSLQESDNEKKKEDLAFAVEYINQAIEDPTHPFRSEIINAFNEADN